MRSALLLIIFLLGGCASSLGFIDSITSSSQSIVDDLFTPSSGSQGRGAGHVTYQGMWDGYRAPNNEYTGADLTRITLHELNFLPPSFYSQVPKDARHWCPAYRWQSLEGRKAFYLALISGIARYETDFRAHLKYLESNRHYSRGILQLGQLALSYYPDSDRCDVSGDPRQLHDLQKNIACGVMLIEHWVNRDQYIGTYKRSGGDGGYYGPARYWATLRKGRRGYDEISSYTRNLPVCRL